MTEPAALSTTLTALPQCEAARPSCMNCGGCFPPGSRALVRLGARFGSKLGSRRLGQNPALRSCRARRPPAGRRAGLRRTCMNCPRDARGLCRPPSASSWRFWPAWVPLPASSSSCRPMGGAGMAGLSGHGLNGLGLDPARLILVETGASQGNAVGDGRGVALGGAASGRRHDRQARSEDQPKAAPRRRRCRPAAVAVAAGPTLEASAAATRWRDRHGGSRARPLRRFTRTPDGICNSSAARNGRPGEWVVEYDHVAHRFSLAAALADPAFSRGASDGAAGQRILHAGRS